MGTVGSHPAETPETPLQLRVDGAVGTIILRRPHRSNALSDNLVHALMQALDDLHRDGRVRGVVLTGAGKSFCAGTDLHDLHAAMADTDAQQQWFDQVYRLRDLMMALLRFPRPILAAVNGPALGTGLALVAASDIVVASSEARFGCPESRRGLTPGITVPLLAFRLGACHAGHLLLRGQVIDASEAMRLGLVHELVAHDLLWARAKEILGEIAASTSPDAATITKRLLNETVGESMLTQLATGAAANAAARTTEPAREGVAAFVQKREPRW
jgi:methylglutaconyl-CoA hydratase